MDTIASISTPLGKGAISIIRMSGKDSLRIAKEVFSCKTEEFEPRKMYLGKFKLKDAYEKCLCVYFKAPFSYTGEDMIEFQVHGGLVITQKILDELLNHGARLANAGEFTKIAFSNGKLSLDEAESIIDEINAESEKELFASLYLSDGKLKTHVLKTQEGLTELLAEIEVNLDYPEESIEEATKEKIFTYIQNIKNEILEILKTSESAKFLKTGVNVAIVGKTNVGKSSLLNALLGEEVAIVTDIAGTTRDSIVGSYEYNGIKFNLVDTAGLRETSDVVEQIGIDRARKSLEKADIVLAVYDASDDADEDLEIGDKVFISVINKCDKIRKLNKKQNEIEVSARENTNINALKGKIYKEVIKNEIDFNKIVLINDRHIEILKECLKDIKNVEDAKTSSLDIISMLIKRLWNDLGKITGNSENEDIINLIFSKFCLGK